MILDKAPSMASDVSILEYARAASPVPPPRLLTMRAGAWARTLLAFVATHDSDTPSGERSQERRTTAQ